MITLKSIPSLSQILCPIEIKIKIDTMLDEYLPSGFDCNESEAEIKNNPVFSSFPTDSILNGEKDGCRNGPLTLAMLLYRMAQKYEASISNVNTRVELKCETLVLIRYLEGAIGTFSKRINSKWIAEPWLLVGAAAKEFVDFSAPLENAWIDHTTGTQSPSDDTTETSLRAITPEEALEDKTIETSETAENNILSKRILSMLTGEAT